MVPAAPVVEQDPPFIDEGTSSTAPPLGVAPEVADRLLDAALVLVARWGVAKSSVADVAKQAGCSRATLYRAFPGGKQHLFHALGVRELDAYLSAVVEAVDEGVTLEESATMGLVVAARLLRDHPGAQFVLAHEPELLLPFLGFHQVEVLYRHASTVVGPHLERFLPAPRAAWAAEWVARIFISYLFNPRPDLDLGDVGHVADLLGRHLLPTFDQDLRPLP